MRKVNIYIFLLLCLILSVNGAKWLMSKLRFDFSHIEFTDDLDDM